MDLKDSFVAFIRAENAEGSNRAASYIRAIELLNDILKRKAPKEFNAESIWSISSARHIQSLYELVLEHQRLKNDGFFRGEEPISYWRDGFCSAALKSYKEFLVTHLYEQRMWETYRDSKIAPEELSAKLAEIDVESAEVLIEDRDIDLKSRVGREVIRETKARIGQGFFRKMILSQYQNQCCITGLNVPEVLRASHITSWADDPENRLNPCNGLCLSATYDAAFDKHLISFDDDYRMILSPVLEEYYTNEAFKEFFLNREGIVISIPKQHRPKIALLDIHRAKLIS